MYLPLLSGLLPLAFQAILPTDPPSDPHQSGRAAPVALTPAAVTQEALRATIVLPPAQPAYAERVDPHLVAFSIEADRWPDWAGHAVGEPNDFAMQVLKNLAERSGEPCAIRVGADSEDRTHLNLSVPVGHAIYPPKTPWFPYPEAERIEVGRDWYRLSQNFAPGTPFTWGLNLKSLNMSETEAQAKRLASAFASAADVEAVIENAATSSKRKGEKGRAVLEAVEIGNEPELYYRPTSGGGVSNPGDWSSWSVSNYTSTWLTYAQAAAKHLDLSETVFRIGDIQYAGSASGWAPQSIMQAGLFGRKDSFARKHVKVYSEHMYQANYDIGHEAESGVLMDKWNVRGNLSRRAMDVVACRKEGMSFVLGETSSYSSHGSPGTSNTAESALWVIDYLLQAASMGISRAYLSHGVGYRYSSFQPIAGITDDGRGLDRAHIMPLYYGLLVVNEAIGPVGHTGDKGEKDEGCRYVVELSTEHPNIVAYGIYSKGRLVRVVLVNTQVRNEPNGKYAAAEGVAARHKNVEVHLESLHHDHRRREWRMKRLDIPYTTAASGLTWAGQDFDTPSGIPTGKVRYEEVHNGVVLIPASSAVLISL